MADLFKDFSGDEYKGEQKSFPFIQLISKDEIERSGLFISKETADRVLFKPDPAWSAFNMKYKGDNKPTPGYLCQNPRIAIVARSKPTVWTKKPQDFVGIYSKPLYNRTLHILKTRHLFMILGADNTLLTASPLQFTTKGAFNGSFGSALTDYQAAFGALLIAHSADKTPRNDKFFAMVVVQLALKVEGRGEEGTACCVVDNIVPPTLENIRSLFLGEDDNMKDLLEGYYLSTRKLMAAFESGNIPEDAPIDGDEWAATTVAPTTAPSKVNLQSIEILPPSVLSLEEIIAKCVQIIQALGYDKNNGRQAIELMTKTVGIGKLSLMSRECKEQVLLELYRLTNQATIDGIPY